MEAEKRRSPHEAGSGYIDNLGGFDATPGKAETHGLLARWILIGLACRDPDLSHGDTAVLWAVLERMGTDGLSWPGYERIAEDAQLHRATAARGIARLVERDYLVRQRGGFGKSNRYRLGSRKAATSGESATSRNGATCNSRKAATSDSRNAATRTRFIEPTTSNPPTIAKREASRASAVTRFAEFWTAYPRKVGAKSSAEKTWARKKLDATADQILAHVRDRAAGDPGWADKQFIPHPTTFLNGERWNDEWKPVTTNNQLPISSADDESRANEINAAALARLQGVRLK